MGLRRLLRKALNIAEPDRYLNQTFSQEGEDGILARVYEHKSEGFYVDVGAHHPKRFSNTYHFYRKGWRGINIDAMPGSMREFDKLRPRDINLEVAVLAEAATLPFYVFNEPALNTFSKPLADERAVAPPYVLERTMSVSARPLADILDEHVPAGTGIDFLTIDAEGKDVEVLCSNDWLRFRPDIVLLESELAPSAFSTSETGAFMRTKGYEFFAKTVKTYILKREDYEVM